MTSSAISAQGTALQIGTGTGGAKTITAIAVGYPTILTCSGHGLTAGTRVTAASFAGADAALLNSLVWTVTNVTTNTFAVQLDSTGKTITVSSSTMTPVTYTAVANVKTMTAFDGSASEIDKTNLASSAKEFALGLIDPGHVTFDLDQDNSDGGQQALRTAQTAGTIQNFKVILPSGTTPTASFTGYVKKITSQLGVDQVVKSSVEIRISGPITWA